MKKILVVDNQPVMLKYMTGLLEKNGHHVTTAPDGLSALECLKTFIPDVIFSDMVMPNISGDKLCRVIRSMPEMKDVFIVIVSGIVLEENVDFIGFGADVCVAKGPFNKMEKHILAVLEQSDSRFTSDLSGKILGLQDLYHREVTEELLSSRNHSEVILSNMAEGILELTRDEKIIFTNPAVASLIGIPEEKLLGSDFISLFHDNHRVRIEELLKEIDDTPKIIPEDLPVILNGKQVSLNFLPVKEQKNRSIIVILNDVDEQKRLEGQLQQARKMESIGTLAGGIAHEFNNALVGITGNIELLKMDLPEDSMDGDITGYIEAMLSSVHKMVKLTKRLLAYARGGKYRSSTISLSNFMEETLPLVKNRVESRIRVETDFPTDIFDVEGDITQMQLVLFAIIDNSVESIEGKGRIRIVARNRDVDKEFAKSRPGLKIGRYACMIVQDDGKGMDEITRSRVFEPFFTTNFQGRGLGLASVYGIIKNHKGWVSVESEVGKGTVVSIYLPPVVATDGKNS